MDDFYRQIRVTRLHAAELYQRARKSLVQQQELLVQGFEELYAVLETLEVAELKLHQQNEELAAAHEALVVEHQRYQNLFEFAKDAYLVTDGKGIIREANRAATKVFNVPQPLLVSKPLVMFVSKQERRAFLTRLATLQQQNLGQDWKVRLQPRNGELIDASLTVTAVRDREGGLLALQWLLRDITRKQAESSLWLLKDIVQQMNEAIVVTSAELSYPGPRVVFVNLAFTKMTGYTLEEMIDKTPRILQGPKTERSILDQLHRNLSQGQIFYGETINYRKNGTEYNVELWCIPIHNERGDIKHFFSIQRDIT